MPSSSMPFVTFTSSSFQYNPSRNAVTLGHVNQRVQGQVLQLKFAYASFECQYLGRFLLFLLTCHIFKRVGIRLQRYNFLRVSIPLNPGSNCTWVYFVIIGKLLNTIVTA